VRTTPNGKVLTRVFRGDTVQVFDAKGNWSFVAVNHSDEHGWINNAGLQEIPCN
jgi:uncharacterized protein YgiM (DUF1202 family)